MTAVSTARTELAAAREQIGETAYRAISAGLDMAEELRSTPRRESSASTRARGGEEFRRQPHLAAADAAATIKP
jgi:hypothetical protein